MSFLRSSDGTTDRRVRVMGKPVDAFPELAAGSESGTVLRITEEGEAILRRRCRDVTEFGTTALSQLIDSMFVTMYAAQGAGLAANQVDTDLRLFVYDCLDDDNVRHVGHILNPEVEPDENARQLVEVPEGCLSVPGARHTLARPDRAVVGGLDKDGNPIRIEGTGYFARCLLHETDHVNGILYIDRLGKRDRRIVLESMRQERDRVLAERAARAVALGKQPADVRPR